MTLMTNGSIRDALTRNLLIFVLFGAYLDINRTYGVCLLFCWSVLLISFCELFSWVSVPPLLFSFHPGHACGSVLLRLITASQRPSHL